MSTSFPHVFTRRRFLQTTGSTAAGLALGAPSVSAAAPDAFSFVLLGDLHFDKLEHHDMAWVEKHQAGDESQIKNYSRITGEIMPTLMATVRESVAATKAAFVLQVGDLVEGLCGSATLAVRQNQEALTFIRDARLGAPFVFTKGNHDVAGHGATEAFKEVFQPFLNEQTATFAGGGNFQTANYAFEHRGALFCFFDAYAAASLDWLEAELAKRTAGHCFVVIHPPVVPYGARATWHLYSSAGNKPKRDKLLELLGRQDAFVLGGHLHKFNTLTRATPGGGKFVQLAVSSVVHAAELQTRNPLSGVAEYNGDQIRVEPAYSAATELERRAVYAAEKPFVKSFEYADLPGHAIVTVQANEVTAEIFSGVSRHLWRKVDLLQTLKG